MDFNKKGLMAILAIICIVISAGAASAADDGQILTDTPDKDVIGDDSGNENLNTDDGSNNPAGDDGYVVDNGLTGEGYDGSQGHDVSVNETAENNTYANTTSNATDDSSSPTADTTAAGNMTNSTSIPNKLNQFVTGNPILVLLAVFAVIAASPLRRK